MVCRLPDGRRYEIDDGELIIMRPAGGRHGRGTNRIAHLLTTFVEEHHVGEIAAGEVGAYLQEKPVTLRGVDVAFF